MTDPIYQSHGYLLKLLETVTDPMRLQIARDIMEHARRAQEQAVKLNHPEQYPRIYWENMSKTYESAAIIALEGLVD